MTLKYRIEHLENNMEGQDTMQQVEITLDDVIRKLGLAPDKIKAIAREKNQSRAEIIAAELGMPYTDFVRELQLRTLGRL